MAAAEARPLRRGRPCPPLATPPRPGSATLARRARPRQIPAAGAREDAPPSGRPRAARDVSRGRSRPERPRPRPARLRGTRPARLPLLWNSGTWLRASSLSRLRFRAAGGLLVQGRGLPLLRRPPDGGRGGPPRPERPAPGAGAAAGPLLPSTRSLPRRPPPRPGLASARRLHPRRLRLAAKVRATAGGGRSTDRGRHRGAEVRWSVESERPL